jgi:hypothetical protein
MAGQELMEEVYSRSSSLACARKCSTQIVDYGYQTKSMSYIQILMDMPPNVSPSLYLSKPPADERHGLPSTQPELVSVHRQNSGQSHV